MTRRNCIGWPFVMVLLFGVACAPDGPSVVRESDPSLVEQATSSTSENRSTESTEKKVGQIPEDEVSGTDVRVGGSATVLLAADPTPITGWTPWDHVCAWSCRNVLDQVLETITVVLPDGSTAPWLAEQVEPNPTMLNWTVTLRKGLRFSDDQPVTAQVIKEGYEEFLKKGEVTRGLLRDARINAVTVIDDRRLMFDLAEPNPALDVVLAGPIGRVFSIEAARVDPSAFIRSPVGTGPFIMEPWEIGQPVKLLANREYWRTGFDGKSLPYLDELTFLEVVDEQERIESVQRKDADFAQSRS
ncbi:MAG: ABC transporter substrate-binding protein, partial [Acidimicrobiales bacterium]|nr:ABC transporter substrate-binding protein [Acidimicrobiales bacterium]